MQLQGPLRQALGAARVRRGRALSALAGSADTLAGGWGRGQLCRPGRRGPHSRGCGDRAWRPGLEQRAEGPRERLRGAPATRSCPGPSGLCPGGPRPVHAPGLGGTGAATASCCLFRLVICSFWI
ncbi:hypothetical protein HJG60_008823 [Phyllostomus discolor]|uniref:Uncharacterized protein n=1 Tax=Phyllostomus discolor TaxID=89673 RepID=A0A834DI66_9CHIR|nr:hypothetical protein HJG60_008823 [Phyllostomus discolor]